MSQPNRRNTRPPFQPKSVPVRPKLVEKEEPKPFNEPLDEIELAGFRGVRGRLELAAKVYNETVEEIQGDDNVLVRHLATRIGLTFDDFKSGKYIIDLQNKVVIEAPPPPQTIPPHPPIEEGPRVEGPKHELSNDPGHDRVQRSDEDSQ